MGITINPPTNALPLNVATKTVRVANMAAHNFYTAPAPAPPVPPLAPPLPPPAPPAPPAPLTPGTAAAPLVLNSTWSDALVYTIKHSSRLQQNLRNITVHIAQLSYEYEALAREIYCPQLLMHLGEVCMHAIAQYTADLDGVAAVQRAIYTAINLLNPQVNTQAVNTQAQNTAVNT